jgi:EmrB/QacA subfamily drug resistance transporter
MGPRRERLRDLGRLAVSERPPGLVGSGRRVRWAVLASLTLVSFLILLDDTAVALALPAIRDQLGLGLVGMEWVVNGYTLPFAALVLLTGQLADRDGRRRIFLVGLALFVLASLAAGLAGDTATLVGARAVQGIGAALVAPASLSIIAATFPARERGWALGVWAGITATALGLGPVFGAVINDSLGWAWIFLLNVPLGMGAWLVARTLLGESRAEHPARRLDVPGAVSSGIALAALLLALTEGNDYGWGSPRVVALVAVAIVALVVFVWIERRSADPLVDLSRLRRRRLAGPNMVTLLASAVMCSMFFFLALYLQIVLDYTALTAGLLLLPLTVAIMIVSPLAGHLADRIGARIPVTAGMLLLAAALFALSSLRVDSSAGSLMPWLALSGIGIGLTTTPATTAALAGSDSDQYGMAAGLLNTSRATGLAFGIALMGAVLAAAGESRGSQAFVDGFSTALTINAIVAIAAAIIAAATLGAHTQRPLLSAASPGAGTRPSTQAAK